jgi:hypothetical protein
VSFVLALTGPSLARPAAATPTGSTPAAGKPAQRSPGHPSPPSVHPRRGKSFVPVQGDWEGSAGGLSASFELTLHSAHGTAAYGIKNLVILRPGGCPLNGSRYTESILGGRLPSPVGRFGSLGLSRFGLQGSFGGARSATLLTSYHLSGCHGTLIWHMHPSTRTAVADGAWTAHFADGESSRFTVQAGGRLATTIGLPHTLLQCNGLAGAFDMFIGRDGRARVTNSGVTLTLRFAGSKATGTLSAKRCSRSGSKMTASHRG